MDQETRQSVVCICKRKDWIDVIRELSGDCQFISVENPVQAILKIPEISNLSFVYIEPQDPESDRHWIWHIRKQVPDSCFLILLKDQVTLEEGRNYMTFGLNDIVDPTAELEVVSCRIDFMRKHIELFAKKAKEPISDPYVYKMPLWKRVFDICFVSIVILCLLPIWILVPLAILVESRGRVVYKSKRVGTGYNVFGFYKFRSMYSDADKRLKELSNLNQYVVDKGDSEHVYLKEEVVSNAVLYSDDSTVDEATYLQERRNVKSKAFVKLQNDPRVTRVGKFIRKYSIDELPQLFNILKGEMSVVGNRPLPLYEAELLTTDDSLERFLAPAGLTGLWQVEKRGKNSTMSPEERKQLDVKYAKHYTFWGDIMIILKTIPAMVQKEDV